MATADPLDRLPTVKDMHLQRVATMAAAAAVAQQSNAEVESHEQFAKELRSYRGQQQRGVVKPSWDSDVESGVAFDELAPGHCSCTLIV